MSKEKIKLIASLCVIVGVGVWLVLYLFVLTDGPQRNNNISTTEFDSTEEEFQEQPELEDQFREEMQELGYEEEEIERSIRDDRNKMSPRPF